MRIVKRLPTPIVGLMLALAASGNLVLSYGNQYRNIFGGLSAIILLLVLLKIIIYPKDIRNDLANPMIASVFPTLSMGIILLSAYLKPLSANLAYYMWILGIGLHIALIIFFTLRYLLNLKMPQVFPSWFIVYVGIAVGAITAPAFNQLFVGKVLFWFGFISYFLLLPIILKRVFSFKQIPEPALPTLAIFAAPVALCLAGYMNSFDEKNTFIVYLLLILSQLSYFLVLTQLPKLLKLKFFPSYSAFTFPLVISAISLKLTNGYFIKIGQVSKSLKILVKFEELVAVLIVLYVLIRYVNFLLIKPEVVAPNEKPAN